MALSEMVSMRFFILCWRVLRLTNKSLGGCCIIS